ncbi:hypothetical protein C8R46DRAFT_36911 [Mycena filopes]|nr:hypothetical protein C8R46DRAFT_36911 [Mycena filopes]
MSPALQNAPREQRLEGLTQSYCHLCELVLTGSTTKAAFQDLERLVKQELDATEEQLRELNSLKQRYVEQGRHDLKILLQEHAEAARKAHYGDNVNSDEDSLQVSELLDRIDNCLATIGDAFQRSQAFWKDIHQNLVKANHWQWEHPASKVERDVIGLESLLPDVRSVVASAQQSTGVKKILAAGVDLVAGAAAVTANCEAIGRAQSAVESQLTSGKASGSPELKEARHAVKSLNRELSSVVGRHAKLSECFRKYSRDVSLLFWSGAARRQERNFEPLVHAVVASHRLPPHQSAFEAAFIGMDSELRGLQASWTV